MKKIMVALLAVTMALGAAPAHAVDRSDAGLLLGALGGGVIGHQFGKGKGNTWATAVGAVTGAVVGQSMGKSLDRGERAYRRQAYTPYADHYGSPTYYNAPAPTRAYYVANPSYESRVRTYEVRPQPVNFYSYQVVDNSISNTAGRYCREYQAPVSVGSRVQESYGIACMQPDGSWQVVN